MRSCAYTLARRNYSDHLTIKVCACDIQLFKHNMKLLPTSNLFHLADYIAITFILSKHDKVDKKIIMNITKNPEICPVNLWTSTIYLRHSYPVFEPNWDVSIFFDERKTSKITRLNVINIICSAFRDIEKDKLGFTKDEIGTHSN